MAAKKNLTEELKTKERALQQREKELDEKIREIKEFRKSLRDLHKLLCPECGHSLQLIAAENLEVQACEECRGAWVDRSSMEILIKYTIDRRKNFFTKVFGLT